MPKDRGLANDGEYMSVNFYDGSDDTEYAEDYPIDSLYSTQSDDDDEDFDYFAKAEQEDNTCAVKADNK
jgi:hypothetical protein